MFAAVLIYILAVMSPGPNFILVSRAAVSHSTISGIGSTIGICAVGLLFSISSVSGLAILLQAFPTFGKVATILGSLYLLYIAYLLLKSVISKASGEESTIQVAFNFFESIKSGIITNITNMKTIAFMISIFSGFLSTERAFNEKVMVIVICSSLEFIWYALVALIFGREKIKNAYYKHSRQIDLILALFLIIFACQNTLLVI